MPPAVLEAPASWQAVEFISDLHLQPAEPATVAAWQRYLNATTADAVFILGDLFEVWVGDDSAAEPGFAADCAAVLRHAAQQRAVYFMHGNRDFLVGADFLQRCGVALLADPCVLAFGHGHWPSESSRLLLSHGDALCLADTDYQSFRAQVRSPAWQADFLARPLAERQAIGRQMRAHSEAAKQAAAGYADVDTAAALAWLHAADAHLLIHGHTHRPADHALDPTHRRVVLSDWDAAATPPRLQVLRLTAAGLQRVALPA